jgi:hypothetical protein
MVVLVGRVLAIAGKMRILDRMMDGEKVATITFM